jgi:hypothetical protein
VSGNNCQDKIQDTDDTNEHNNQFPKQGYTQSHYRESENVKPIFLGQSVHHRQIGEHF